MCLSVSTHAIHVTSYSPVSSSPVTPPLPLSDFPLLGSSRTGESFTLFHVLRSSSGLPLEQLNPFALRRSVARVLGVQFLDISKLFFPVCRPYWGHWWFRNFIVP